MERKKQTTISNKQKDKRDMLYFGSIVAMFVCLLVLVAYFWWNLTKKSAVQNQPSTQVTAQDIGNVKGDTEAKWIAYKNPQYGFQLELPRHLGKQESRDVPGYAYMVIFTENSLTVGKGAAIAVSLNDLNKEIAETKVALSKDGEAELVEEKDATLGGEPAKQVSFKPKGDDKSLQEKTYIIARHGSYTYVVSTVPEQVERVVESFKFL